MPTMIEEYRRVIHAWKQATDHASRKHYENLFSALFELSSPDLDKTYTQKSRHDGNNSMHMLCEVGAIELAKIYLAKLTTHYPKREKQLSLLGEILNSKNHKQQQPFQSTSGSYEANFIISLCLFSDDAPVHKALLEGESYAVAEFIKKIEGIANLRYLGADKSDERFHDSLMHSCARIGASWLMPVIQTLNNEGYDWQSCNMKQQRAVDVLPRTAEHNLYVIYNFYSNALTIVQKEILDDAEIKHLKQLLAKYPELVVATDNEHNTLLHFAKNITVAAVLVAQNAPLLYENNKGIKALQPLLLASQQANKLTELVDVLAEVTNNIVEMGHSIPERMETILKETIHYAKTKLIEEKFDIVAKVIQSEKYKDEPDTWLSKFDSKLLGVKKKWKESCVNFFNEQINEYQKISYFPYISPTLREQYLQRMTNSINELMTKISDDIKKGMQTKYREANLNNTPAIEDWINTNLVQFQQYVVDTYDKTKIDPKNETMHNGSDNNNNSPFKDDRLAELKRWLMLLVTRDKDSHILTFPNKPQLLNLPTISLSLTLGMPAKIVLADGSADPKSLFDKLRCAVLEDKDPIPPYHNVALVLFNHYPLEEIIQYIKEAYDGATQDLPKIPWIEKSDLQGNTVLHWALYNHQCNVALTLLKAIKDAKEVFKDRDNLKKNILLFNVPNNIGKTPLQLARHAERKFWDEFIKVYVMPEVEVQQIEADKNADVPSPAEDITSAKVQGAVDTKDLLNILYLPNLPNAKFFKYSLQVKVLRLLDMLGEPLDRRDEYGRALIHYAFTDTKEKVLRYLLSEKHQPYWVLNSDGPLSIEWIVALADKNPIKKMIVNCHVLHILINMLFTDQYEQFELLISDYDPAFFKNVANFPIKFSSAVDSAAESFWLSGAEILQYVGKLWGIDIKDTLLGKYNILKPQGMKIDETSVELLTYLEKLYPQLVSKSLVNFRKTIFSQFRGREAKQAKNYIDTSDITNLVKFLHLMPQDFFKSHAANLLSCAFAHIYKEEVSYLNIIDILRRSDVITFLTLEDISRLEKENCIKDGTTGQLMPRSQSASFLLKWINLDNAIKKAFDESDKEKFNAAYNDRKKWFTELYLSLAGNNVNNNNNQGNVPVNTATLKAKIKHWFIQKFKPLVFEPIIAINAINPNDYAYLTQRLQIIPDDIANNNKKTTSKSQLSYEEVFHQALQYMQTGAKRQLAAILTNLPQTFFQQYAAQLWTNAFINASHEIKQHNETTYFANNEKGQTPYLDILHVLRQSDVIIFMPDKISLMQQITNSLQAAVQNPQTEIVIDILLKWFEYDALIIKAYNTDKKTEFENYCQNRKKFLVSECGWMIESVSPKISSVIKNWFQKHFKSNLVNTLEQKNDVEQDTSDMQCHEFTYRDHHGNNWLHAVLKRRLNITLNALSSNKNNNKNLDKLTDSFNSRLVLLFAKLNQANSVGFAPSDYLILCKDWMRYAKESRINDGVYQIIRAIEDWLQYQGALNAAYYGDTKLLAVFEEGTSKLDEPEVQDLFLPYPQNDSSQLPLLHAAILGNQVAVVEYLEKVICKRYKQRIADYLLIPNAEGENALSLALNAQPAVARIVARLYYEAILHVAAHGDKNTLEKLFTLYSANDSRYKYREMFYDQYQGIKNFNTRANYFRALDFSGKTLNLLQMHRIINALLNCAPPKPDTNNNNRVIMPILQVLRFTFCITPFGDEIKAASSNAPSEAARPKMLDDNIPAKLPKELTQDHLNQVAFWLGKAFAAYGNALTAIDVCGMGLTDIHFAWLLSGMQTDVSYPQLTTLNLAHNKLTNQSIAQIKHLQLPALKSLHIEANQKLSWVVIENAKQALETQQRSRKQETIVNNAMASYDIEIKGIYHLPTINSLDEFVEFVDQWFVSIPSVCLTFVNDEPLPVTNFTARYVTLLQKVRVAVYNEYEKLALLPNSKLPAEYLNKDHYLLTASVNMAKAITKALNDDLYLQNKSYWPAYRTDMLWQVYSCAWLWNYQLVSTYVRSEKVELNNNDVREYQKYRKNFLTHFKEAVLNIWQEVASLYNDIRVSPYEFNRRLLAQLDDCNDQGEGFYSKDCRRLLKAKIDEPKQVDLRLIKQERRIEKTMEKRNLLPPKQNDPTPNQNTTTVNVVKKISNLALSSAARTFIPPRIGIWQQESSSKMEYQETKLQPVALTLAEEAQHDAIKHEHNNQETSSLEDINTLAKQKNQGVLPQQAVTVETLISQLQRLEQCGYQEDLQETKLTPNNIVLSQIVNNLVPSNQDKGSKIEPHPVMRARMLADNYASYQHYEIWRQEEILALVGEVILHVVGAQWWLLDPKPHAQVPGATSQAMAQTLALQFLQLLMSVDLEELLDLAKDHKKLVFVVATWLKHVPLLKDVSILDRLGGIHKASDLVQQAGWQVAREYKPSHNLQPILLLESFDLAINSNQAGPYACWHTTASDYYGSSPIIVNYLNVLKQSAKQPPQADASLWLAPRTQQILSEKNNYELVEFTPISCTMTRISTKLDSVNNKLSDVQKDYKKLCEELKQENTKIKQENMQILNENKSLRGTVASIVQVNENLIERIEKLEKVLKQLESQEQVTETNSSDMRFFNGQR
ncbi:MAG: hypothetical protein Tsb005_01040 [Gammaproteobacteria bacterium]